MEMSKKDKVIARIAKLLAMAKDVSSPEEAMIAAKRARHLMDKHQLSENDIEASLKQNDEFLADSTERSGSTIRQWLVQLQVASAILNDCESLIYRGRKARYEFRGYASDVVVAKLMFEYLIGACERLCQASGLKGHSLKNAYRVGFATRLSRRALEIKEERDKLHTHSGKGLVHLKEEAIKKHFGVVEATYKPTQRPLSQAEYYAYKSGQKDGDAVGLDTQVGNTHKEGLAAAS